MAREAPGRAGHLDLPIERDCQHRMKLPTKTKYCTPLLAKDRWSGRTMFADDRHFRHIYRPHTWQSCWEGHRQRQRQA
ncbi:uncharacterized protein L969DRAFT_496245, partial [Mixia osmundae IAM 14324]|uniref:uncharacterized protein n=1 Tax=Mixia osmundae (strain CBS 9802 / IAM 14324 / JCM 22182 / KY 12970) TaxID=764103 RepID=UPI0004A54761